MTFLKRNMRAFSVMMCLALMVPASGGLHAQDPSSGSRRQLFRRETIWSPCLHSDVARFQPGQRITLAVKYDITPGWHLYWKNPGDNGMPPGLSIQAPPGVIVGAPLYPRPMIFQEGEGESIQTSFGYERSLCLLVPVGIPDGFEADSLDLSIELQWFVCKDICLIGTGAVCFRFQRPCPAPLDDGSGRRRLIRTWQSRMPLPAAKARISAAFRDGMLVVSGPSGVFGMRFIRPHAWSDPAVRFRSPPSSMDPCSPLRCLWTSDLGCTRSLRAAGLVLMGSYDRPRAISVDVPVSITPRGPILRSRGGPDSNFHRTP